MFTNQQLGRHVPLGRVFPEMFGQRRNVLVALAAGLALELFLEPAAFAFGNASRHHFPAQNGDSSCWHGLCNCHAGPVAVEMEIGGMVGPLVDGEGALCGRYRRASSGAFVGHGGGEARGETGGYTGGVVGYTGGVTGHRGGVVGYTGGVTGHRGDVVSYTGDVLVTLGV